MYILQIVPKVEHKANDDIKRKSLAVLILFYYLQFSKNVK